MIRDTNGDTWERIEAHAPLAGKRILEIGCGPGRVTAELVGSPRLVVGIEPDFREVRTASAGINGAHFLCASGAALPFAAGSFDVVLYTLSLHHHPDCGEALAEACRVLAPSGRITAIEPTPQSEIQRLCNVFENEDDRLRHVTDSLARTALETRSAETFSTSWEFTDFEDLADFAFTYYRHPPDAAKREALREFLGSRVEDAPLRMTDTLRLTCLNKD